MLGQDSARAFYGPGHVRAAAELGAIQTLLMSDTLFRVNDVAKVCAKPSCCEALCKSGSHHNRGCLQFVAASLVRRLHFVRSGYLQYVSICTVC